jgi:hypothetical protein
MADAEDLKSSGDFSSWGFDSPPGHHQSTMFMRLFRCQFPGVPATCPCSLDLSFD